MFPNMRKLRLYVYTHVSPISSRRVTYVKFWGSKVMWLYSSKHYYNVIMCQWNFLVITPRFTQDIYYSITHIKAHRKTVSKWICSHWFFPWQGNFCSRTYYVPSQEKQIKIHGVIWTYNEVFLLESVTIFIRPWDYKTFFLQNFWCTAAIQHFDFTWLIA